MSVLLQMATKQKVVARTITYENSASEEPFNFERDDSLCAVCLVQIV